MKTIPEKWRKLFELIPGYDPVATAGDCCFDVEKAESTVKFFAKMMTHIEGEKAGQSFVLEPWQAAHVGCAFGWKRPDGRRRYREVFDYEPRKQGKSTKLGGLINYVALCDDEPGAQIYSAASEREQAGLVYRQAEGMLHNHPELQDEVDSGAIKIYKTFKSIEYPNGVVYKALSADAASKHGFNTHFVVVDELHAQPNRDLVDVLVTSTGSRRQPLIWYITTADFDRESICNEKYDYAKKVRDGVIDDPSFLPIIYEAGPDDDYESETTWRRANPNLGVSVSLEYIRRECQRAKESPAYLNTFLRLHLNRRTQNNVAWLDMARWDACGDSLDLHDLAGRPCYAGLDLSSNKDVTALVLAFPSVDGVDVLPFFWVPADEARQREKRDRVPYSQWIREGYIEATPGNAIDYDVIRQRIGEIAERYEIKELATDPWNAQQITTQLQGDGFNVVTFRQGFASMSSPTKELETLMLGGKINHGGNPVLRWMASNVTVETDAAGNLKPSKKKSTEKIDGIVALVMAIGRMSLRNGDSESVYADRGIVFI